MREREKMEKDTPWSSATPYSGGVGAGGKFRRPSRKPPSTPYDRPPVPVNNNQSDESQDGGGGWLSKLVVNPARRLIVSGATRILPSFFSKSDSLSDEEDDDIPPLITGDHDNQDADTTVDAFDDPQHASKLGVSSLTGDAGPSNGMGRLKGHSEYNNAEQDKSKNVSGDLDLAKIEGLVKGKRFSRDEINRLTEILNSRVVDVSDAEREKATLSVISLEQAKENFLDRETPSAAVMGKLHHSDLAPRFQSNTQDDVAASPIDLARAYMGSRTSELGHSSYSILSKDRIDQQQNDLFASKPYIPSTSPKSSTCWPGAMVQDQRGYGTPQNQRGRQGLHNFPRTPYSPYSRTIYSRTKPQLTQLQADSRSLNISSTPFQQSRTPNYGKMKSSIDVMNGGYGSVGPTRGVRNKFATEHLSKGTRYSAQIASPQVEQSSASRSFVPVYHKNLEIGGAGDTSNVHSVDRSEQASKGLAIPTGPSNETVKKILEHLDRHKPTPKEKAAELKLATDWKRSPSQDNNVMPKESTSIASLTVSDLHKISVSSDQRYSAEGTDDRGNSEGMPTKASNAVTKTSSLVPKDGCIMKDAGAGPSFAFRNTSDSQIRNADEKAVATSTSEKETSQLWSLGNPSNGKDLTRKRSSQPALKPISFTRQDPQQVISSNNGSGFSFPFSVTSNSTSEPPTPSIMPSFPGAGVSQSTEVPAIPAYSFGTKKSSQRVVFSFPSTSSTSIDDGASDLNFNFGSDKKRVSFGSIGKDAIVIN